MYTHRTEKRGKTVLREPKWALGVGDKPPVMVLCVIQKLWSLEQLE